jgi:hypothetical protein
MSAELRDFRGKITVETDTVLDAIARSSGKDRSEIARDVLHRWAEEQIHVASLIDQRLKAEGLLALVEGERGSVAR